MKSLAYERRRRELYLKRLAEVDANISRLREYEQIRSDVDYEIRNTDFEWVKRKLPPKTYLYYGNTKRYGNLPTGLRVRVGTKGKQCNFSFFAYGGIMQAIEAAKAYYLKHTK